MLSRLSGSTAEFLSMWNIMMAGHQPFLLEKRINSPNISDSCVVLSLRPILPAWLFDIQTKSISFTFLGAIHVTYKNPNLIDSWTGTSFKGRAVAYGGSIYSSISNEDHQDSFECNTASLVRERKIKSIEITIL